MRDVDGVHYHPTQLRARSQLLESGRLLAEAQQSFETVTAGFGDAGGTIAGLRARLDQKQKDLVEAEKELRGSRAEVTKLKKVTILTERDRLWESIVRQLSSDATKTSTVRVVRKQG